MSRRARFIKKGRQLHPHKTYYTPYFLYYPDYFTCLKRILSRQKYAGNFYTKFRLVRDGNGYRIFGAFNTSDFYQFAYVTAQTKRIGGQGGLGDHVVPVPALLSLRI